MKCPGCGNEFIADADTALCPECEEKLKWIGLNPMDPGWETIPDKGGK